MLIKTVQKLKKINPWHILWISIIISEIITLLCSSAASMIFWSEVSRDVLKVGFIDALIVPLIIVPIVIYLMRQTSTLEELNEKLTWEIEERKLFEAKLEHISGEWRKTFDSTQDVMIMLNAEFEVVRANSATIIMFGKGFHAMVGARISKLFNNIQLPVDMNDLMKVRESRHREELETYFPEKHRWFVISVDPILDQAGSVSGSVLVIRDNTEMKAMQASLLTVKNDWEDTFNTITDMITIHDMDYNIVRANEAAHRVMNIPDLEITKSLKCFKYYHGTDKPPEQCLSCNCLKTGEYASFEIFEPNLNKYIEIRSIPRIDEDNNIKGLIHVVRDLTDIKTAAEDKSNLEQQLLHVQKMDSIGRLAGGVAHDFNNIVSVIIGYSELVLKEVPEGSSLKENVSAIHGAGEKAAALTKKLLAFSRKQVLEMKAVNMERVIENMTKILTRLVPENVTLICDSQAKGQKVLADPTQMEQILMNLVVNARDAMPDGGRLTIKTSEVEFEERHVVNNKNLETGSYVLLAVTDTGTGMSSEVQDKIFEPFFSTKEVGKGTGMGLATVYGIVKQHKGHIDVQSEPGKGTTFSIYLPAAEGETEARAEEKPERILTGSETILVVDDEPLLKDIIVEMLKPLGYTVLKASHGKEALLISSKFSGKIDLLLTDVIMPGMNGKELADALINIRPEIKVVFISGYTDDAIAHHGVLEEGVVLIQKPLTEKMLASKIREVLDRDNHSLALCPEHESLDGIHILLADDNEDIRKLITSFLKGHKCHLDTAENGKIAVEKYKRGSYDYVLMDMQMPVMDGLAAVREIRKWEKENDVMLTTIIALTGNATQEDIDLCLEAGYTSHLAKPIKKDQLMKAILSYTSSKQDHRGEAEKEVREKVVAYVDSDLKDLIPEYLEERQNDIIKIQSAMNAEDYETVRIMGHTLKGSGGGYGFEQITEIGVHLEEAAKQENPEGIKKMIQELTDYMDNVDIVYE